MHLDLHDFELNVSDPNNGKINDFRNSRANLAIPHAPSGLSEAPQEFGGGGTSFSQHRRREVAAGGGEGGIPQKHLVSKVLETRFPGI